MKKSITALFLLGFCREAVADYVITGNFTADNCTTVFKKICTIEIVTAFKNKGSYTKRQEDLLLYQVMATIIVLFKFMIEFPDKIPAELQEVLLKKPSATLWTPKNKLISFTEFPDFYKKNQSGQFIKLSPSYVAFKKLPFIHYSFANRCNCNAG